MAPENKMLQLLLDGQSKLLKEILENRRVIEKVDERVTKIGLSLAYLEDDTPTREEHDNLDKRVKKIERKLSLS